MAFSSVPVGGHLALWHCCVRYMTTHWHDQESQNPFHCPLNPTYKSFASDLRMTIIIIPVLQGVSSQAWPQAQCSSNFSGLSCKGPLSFLFQVLHFTGEKLTPERLCTLEVRKCNTQHIKTGTPSQHGHAVYAQGDRVQVKASLCVSGGCSNIYKVSGCIREGQGLLRDNTGAQTWELCPCVPLPRRSTLSSRARRNHTPSTQEVKPPECGRRFVACCYHYVVLNSNSWHWHKPPNGGDLTE